MSVKLYDDSFVNKLKKISEKTDIHVYGPNESTEMFEITADNADDANIKLPIIVLHHEGGYQILEKGNNARSKNALTVRPVIGETLADCAAVQLNEIPISISYTIDVYARFYEEADAIMRELVFILTNSPTIDVIIPYDGIDYVHRSALSLGDNVQDNSDIQEHFIKGQFTRLTIDCTIPDAHLFDTRVRQVVSLEEELGLIIHTSDSDIEHELLRVK